MGQNFKPSGYNSVSPYLVVKGAQEMMDLLTKIFDAKELRRYDLPDGSIMHAEVQLDDSVIWWGMLQSIFHLTPISSTFMFLMSIRYLK